MKKIERFNQLVHGSKKSACAQCGMCKSKIKGAQALSKVDAKAEVKALYGAEAQSYFFYFLHSAVVFK